MWWGNGGGSYEKAPAGTSPDRVCATCKVERRTYREMGSENLISECPRCGDAFIKTPGRAKTIDAINRAENVRKKL